MIYQSKIANSYNSYLVSAELNQRFSDFTDGSILNGFRLVAGTQNGYASVLKDVGDTDMAMITNSGARVWLEEDLYNVIQYDTTRTSQTRVDVVYVKYHHGEGAKMIEFEVVKGLPGQPEDILWDSDTRTPIGLIRVPVLTNPASVTFERLPTGLNMKALYFKDPLLLPNGIDVGHVEAVSINISGDRAATATDVRDEGTRSRTYTDQKIADLIDSAPGVLDTLDELAQALGDDPNFATTMTNALATKVNNTTFYTHVADMVKHITSTERNTWNAKETPTGAQTKANTAEANAKTYTDQKVAALVNSAPGLLDTLDELAQAIGDDPNFATTMTTLVNTKSATAETNAKAYTDTTRDALKDGVIPALDTLRKLALSINNDPTYHQTVDAKLAAAKVITDAHAADAVRHITSSERSTWNAKETPSGAQTKATAAETNAKAYTDATKVALVDNAATTLNTLGKIAASIGNDPDVWTTLTNQIATKADLSTYNTHAADAVRHITASERTSWNATETPSGAQAKATAAETNAKAYTDTKVANLVNSAPGLLDTLDELAQALGDDPNFATTMTNALATKVDNTTFNTHNTDAVRHITSSERTSWNAKETPTGAQTKANTAETNAKNASLPRTGGTLSNTYASPLTLERTGSSANIALEFKHDGGSKFLGFSSDLKLKVGNDANVSVGSEVEFTTGAQAKVDAHAADAVKHITTSERTAWNNKSDKGHTHSFSELTNVPATFPATEHTHPYLPLEGGDMSGETYGYFPSNAETMVGNEYNLLMNAHKRPEITVTMTGSAPLSQAQTDSLFNGQLGPAYSAQGIDPANPVVILIEGLPSTHTQRGGMIGWTSRYWYPRRYKVEVYDTSGTARWKTLIDQSSTPRDTRNLCYLVRQNAQEGKLEKIRITIYESAGGSIGSNGFGRWGLSQIFFVHQEAMRVNEFLDVKYIGGKTVEELSLAGHTHAWSELTGRPSTYAPSAHTHAISEVNGLQGALDGKSANGHGHSDATTSAPGFMSAADKAKLNGIATNANNYTHPSTHPASMIVEDTGRRFITDVERARWNAISGDNAVTYEEATPTKAGLMPAADKAKLDNVAANANNYVHPSSHPASIITQDASNRFVTDTEKANWNAKETTSGAQARVDAHSNDTVRHITSTERNTWNAKETTSGAQAKANTAETNAKAYTDTKVAALVNSAPGLLDTLDELAQALGDDPNFATTMTNALATKVNTSLSLVAGTGLSGGGSLTTNRTFSVNFGGNGGATTVSRSDHHHDGTYIKHNGGGDVTGPIRATQEVSGTALEVKSMTTSKKARFVYNDSQEALDLVFI